MYCLKPLLPYHACPRTGIRLMPARQCLLSKVMNSCLCRVVSAIPSHRLLLRVSQRQACLTIFCLHVGMWVCGSAPVCICRVGDIGMPGLFIAQNRDTDAACHAINSVARAFSLSLPSAVAGYEGRVNCRQLDSAFRDSYTPLMQATLTPRQPHWPPPLPRGDLLPSPMQQPSLRPSRRTAVAPTRLHSQVRTDSI
jgi:hypothetical protein